MNENSWSENNATEESASASQRRRENREDDFKRRNRNEQRESCEKETGKRKKIGIFCDVCQKKMRSRYHLKLHSAVHTGEKNFICGICGKSYQQKWNLITHVGRVHSNEKPFKCSECDKAFGYSSHFKKHMKVHFLEKIEAPQMVKKRILNPHKCERCEKSFETKYRLELHGRRHTGVRPFVCDKCGKRFTTRRLIAVHMKKKHETDTFEFICEQCGKPFGSRYLILLHLKTDHQIEASGEKGRSTSDLENRMKIPVRKKETIPCEVCGKKISRGSIKKHLNIHYRNRIHACKYCKKEFLESGQKTVHERKHTGEKPYLCDVCGRGHSQYGNLLTHRTKYHNLTDKTPRLWKRNSATKEKNDATREDVKTDGSSKSDLNVDAEMTFQTSKFTGDETIEEFLKIASVWINKKFEESKTNKFNQEDLGNEAEEAEVKDESDDDIPLAKLDVSRRSTDEDFGKDVEEKSKTQVELNEKPEEEPAIENQQKNVRIKDLKKRMNQIIYEKIIEDLNAIDKTATDKTIEKIELLRQRKERDPLKELLKLMKTPPDNSVTKIIDNKICWHCWKCSSKFSVRHLLSRHLLIHEPEEFRPYRCEMCRKTFTQSNNYKEHVMSHKNENQYYCDKCGSGFRHKTHFNSHLSRHEPEKATPKPRKHECEFCNKKFVSNFHKNEHQNTHTKEKPYLCKTCGSQFGALSTLNRHLKIHSNLKHQCHVCLKVFVGKFSLKRHLNIHSDNPENRVSCECGISFSQQASLKKHKKICKLATEPVFKPYDCCICSKKFVTNSDLKRHVETHVTCKKFKCEICNTLLKTEETYKRHFKRHCERNADENLVCHHCSSRFCDMKSLRKHIVSNHAK